MKIGEVYVTCIMTDWMLVDVETGCILSFMQSTLFWMLIDSPTVDCPALLYNFEKK